MTIDGIYITLARVPFVLLLAIEVFVVTSCYVGIVALVKKWRSKMGFNGYAPNICRRCGDCTACGRPQRFWLRVRAAIFGSPREQFIRATSRRLLGRDLTKSERVKVDSQLAQSAYLNEVESDDPNVTRELASILWKPGDPHFEKLKSAYLNCEEIEPGVRVVSFVKSEPLSGENRVIVTLERTKPKGRDVYWDEFAQKLTTTPNEDGPVGRTAINRETNYGE